MLAKGGFLVKILFDWTILAFEQPAFVFEAVSACVSRCDLKCRYGRYFAEVLAVQVIQVSSTWRNHPLIGCAHCSYAEYRWRSCMFSFKPADELRGIDVDGIGLHGQRSLK